MKERIILGLFCVTAGLLMTPQANGQVCDLPTFAGPWVFSTDGFQFPPTLFLASAGRFVASPNGVLTITQTAAIDGSIVRQETDTGSVQINSDCTGGALTFNVSSRPIQFDFFFVNNSEILLVGSNNADIIEGSAKRFTGAACPVNPFDAVTGTWVFSSEGFQFPPTLFLASAGRFVASPAGALTITQTAAIDGSIVRQETDAGSFQVNSDCTGGTLTFNVSSRPIQFDFFFVNGNEIRIVSSSNDTIVVGVARRFVLQS